METTKTQKENVAEVKRCDISFAELEQAAKPLVELLRKKGNPLIEVKVTCRNIDVTQALMGVPLSYED